MSNINRATIVTELPGDKFAFASVSAWIGTWSLHNAPVPKWSKEVAKERARFHVLFETQGDSEPYLLVGRRVVAAFGLPADAEWFEWYRTAEHKHTMIPVPAKGGRTKFLKLVEDLATGKLPEYSWKNKEE